MNAGATRRAGREALSANVRETVARSKFSVEGEQAKAARDDIIEPSPRSPAPARTSPVGDATVASVPTLVYGDFEWDEEKAAANDAKPHHQRAARKHP
jgi:hypothetical protein